MNGNAGSSRVEACKVAGVGAPLKALQKVLFTFMCIAQPQPFTNINIHYLQVDTSKYL
jgi:hypothetical protein